MRKKELYIGTKVIFALPMTRQAYNDYRGWKLPDDEQHLAHEDGYLVEYADGGESNHPAHDGYISWSPKSVFTNAYRASGEMNFGMATEAAKRGFRVARRGWNGADMFAYIVPANIYPAQTDMIKGVFSDDMVPYREYWALKTAQNDVAVWSPSGSDTLADDWVIVE